MASEEVVGFRGQRSPNSTRTVSTAQLWHQSRVGKKSSTRDIRGAALTSGLFTRRSRGRGTSSVTVDEGRRENKVRRYFVYVRLESRTTRCRTDRAYAFRRHCLTSCRIIKSIIEGRCVFLITSKHKEGATCGNGKKL